MEKEMKVEMIRDTMKGMNESMKEDLMIVLKMSNIKVAMLI